MFLCVLSPIFEFTKLSSHCECVCWECYWNGTDVYSTNRDRYMNCMYLLCSVRYFHTDTRNQLFSVTLDTTVIGNQTVACTQLSEEARTFECEFCYSAGISCQNIMTCISASASPTLLPTLREMAYCYRATASINHSTVAVIQDIFSTGMYGHDL